MSCTVKKMEWEYGETYGHVYVPHDLDDFARKLHALHTHASHTHYPFYLHIYFTNNTFIGIILGLDTSVFDFAEIGPHAGTGEHNLRPITFAWCETADTAWCEFYYGGSLSNLPPQQFLPLDTVLHALMHYGDHLKLLPSIPLRGPEYMEKYGEGICVGQDTGRVANSSDRSPI